jgi:hypothetical protein
MCAKNKDFLHLRLSCKFAGRSYSSSSATPTSLPTTSDNFALLLPFYVEPKMTFCVLGQCVFSVITSLRAGPLRQEALNVVASASSQTLFSKPANEKKVSSSSAAAPPEQELSALRLFLHRLCCVLDKAAESKDLIAGDLCRQIHRLLKNYTVHRFAAKAHYATNQNNTQCVTFVGTTWEDLAFFKQLGPLLVDFDYFGGAGSSGAVHEFLAMQDVCLSNVFSLDALVPRFFDSRSINVSSYRPPNKFHQSGPLSAFADAAAAKDPKTSFVCYEYYTKENLAAAQASGSFVALVDEFVSAMTPPVCSLTPSATASATVAEPPHQQKHSAQAPEKQQQQQQQQQSQDTQEKKLLLSEIIAAGEHDLFDFGSVNQAAFSSQEWRAELSDCGTSYTALSRFCLKYTAFRTCTFDIEVSWLKDATQPTGFAKFADLPGISSVFTGYVSAVVLYDSYFFSGQYSRTSSNKTTVLVCATGFADEPVKEAKKRIFSEHTDVSESDVLIFQSEAALIRYALVHLSQSDFVFSYYGECMLD